VPAEGSGALTGLALAVLAVVCLPREMRRRMAIGARTFLSASAEPAAARRRLRLPSLAWRAVTVSAVLLLVANDPALDPLWTARAECIYPANASTENERITELAYDFDGHLTQVNCPEGVINYGYDLATGRRTSTCTINSEVAYGYDALGRLETVRVLKRNGAPLGTPEQAVYTYTKTGSRETVSLPNGVVTTYLYDSLNRLTNLTHQAGSTNLATYSYKLHPTGRRTNAVEILRQEDGTYLTNTLNWAYDGMYRLTNEVSASTSSAGQYSTAYQYDLVGNRLKKLQISGSSTNSVESAFDLNDELLTEVMRLNGSLTEKGSNVRLGWFRPQHPMLGAVLDQL
jgi:hypothetical protein